MIGTLWPLSDLHAVGITENVYTAVMATGNVAGAVHTTTREFRDRMPGHPSFWASHIHVGV